jgi:hypothetical protein
MFTLPFKKEEMNLNCSMYVFMILPSQINLTLNLINIKKYFAKVINVDTFT